MIADQDHLYRLVITAGDRERGTTRVRDETLAVVRLLYEGLLARDPRANVVITIAGEPAPPLAAGHGLQPGVGG